MKPIQQHLATPIIATLLMLGMVNTSIAEEDLLIIDESDSTLLMIDESEAPLVIENNDSELLIIDGPENNSLQGVDQSETIFVIEKDSSKEIFRDDNTFSQNIASSSSKPSFKVDNIWLEYGRFTQRHSGKNSQGYGHGLATFQWSPSSEWAIKVSARADGYFETGRDNWDDIDLDYDEIYIRYTGENSIVTLGTQKVLWGRIDEFPPIDRLSTQDLRRFVIDDLEDRRLASPAIRLEHFFASNKLDMVFYPHFREAQLADKDSTWYPVNRDSGKILGLKTNAAMEAVITAAPIRENPPDSEGGFGIRFSSIGSNLDYAVSVQRGRQTLPYFSYNSATNTIEGEYPRTWIIGADMGFEALGGTAKLEAAWLSDTPATDKNGQFTTVKSVNWGVALELFPGDGDSRLNLQLTGTKMMRAPMVIDRAESYTFNGTYMVPFANNRWRAKTRFYIGLDEKDIYLNPEIAFIGWTAQELYLEFHFFDGAKGTPSGFYEDNSLATLGWRRHF